jgi:hypothetical protein
MVFLQLSIFYIEKRVLISDDVPQIRFYNESLDSNTLYTTTNRFDIKEIYYLYKIFLYFFGFKLINISNDLHYQ